MPCHLVPRYQPMEAGAPSPLAHCDLPASVRAPGQAREFVAKSLNDLGNQVAPDYVWVAQYIASELVTNAVLHARTDVQLGLAYAEGALLITVADGVPGMSDAPPVSGIEDQEHGRGMTSVATLADDFGWQQSPEASGKVVWATLATGR